MGLPVWNDCAGGHVVDRKTKPNKKIKKIKNQTKQKAKKQQLQRITEPRGIDREVVVSTGKGRSKGGSGVQG